MTDFVRVKDLSTGHEMDVPESVAADSVAFEILKGYPPNETGYARPAKHRINTKAAKPAATTTEKD